MCVAFIKNISHLVGLQWYIIQPSASLNAMVVQPHVILVIGLHNHAFLPQYLPLIEILDCIFFLIQHVDLCFNVPFSTTLAICRRFDLCYCVRIV